MISVDHITIRTADISAASAFFRDVFGLEEGSRPKVIQRIPGVWLYGDGHPIVHVIGSRGIDREAGAEAIDHVGFRLDGYWPFRARLERLGIAYSLQDIAELGERRVFLRAPGGPLLEAVFDEKVQDVSGAQ